MITNIKNKYLIQIVAFIAMFLIFASPVLAEEISPESIIKYVNQSRAKQGISELTANEKLNQVAKDKLNDMIENKYFAHTSPEGINPWHWFSQNEYDYQFAGENLAINFLDAKDQHEAWMNSPTHKKNILNVNYAEIGVAVGAGKIDGQVSIIAVQEFGTQVGVNPLENGKSTSAQKDGNLIKDEGKIVPQVLSVKNEKNENLAPKNENEKNAPKNIFEYFQNNKQVMIDFIQTLSVLMLMISLALIPIVFIGVAGKQMITFYGNKKQDVRV